MSRVYFHSPSGTAELRGSERAYAGTLCSRLMLAVLGLDYDAKARYGRFVVAGHYLHDISEQVWERSFSTALGVGDGPLLLIDGEAIDGFTLGLNTAVTIGNDAVKFLARLHGQCEIHGFVEGPNRAWLADILAAGQSSGIYRDDQGWPTVEALLRTRADEPVVMSYSVCEQFPNPSVSDWLPPWPEGVKRDWSALSTEQQRARETRSEAWYELPKAEQWERSSAALRASDDGLELKPDNWQSFLFGNLWTAFDVVEAAYRTSEPSDQAP